MLAQNRINGRCLERHGLFRCGAFIAARSHRPSINIRKRPRTSGMKCSRGDAQIGGYLPLPLKKIGRRNGACAPCWVLLSKKYRSQRLIIFRRPSPAVTREISRRDACGNLPHLSTWVSADLPAKHQKPAAWSPEEPVQQSGHRYRWSATSERLQNRFPHDTAPAVSVTALKGAGAAAVAVSS